jgi:hypothetical protein
LAPRILARKKIRASEIITCLTEIAREQLILGKLTREKKFLECCTTVQQEKTFFVVGANLSLGVTSSDHFDEHGSENLVTRRAPAAMLFNLTKRVSVKSLALMLAANSDPSRAKARPG